MFERSSINYGGNHVVTIGDSSVNLDDDKFIIGGEISGPDSLASSGDSAKLKSAKQAASKSVKRSASPEIIVDEHLFLGKSVKISRTASPSPAAIGPERTTPPPRHQIAGNTVMSVEVDREYPGTEYVSVNSETDLVHESSDWISSDETLNAIKSIQSPSRVEDFIQCNVESEKAPESRLISNDDVSKVR